MKIIDTNCFSRKNRLQTVGLLTVDTINYSIDQSIHFLFSIKIAMQGMFTMHFWEEGTSTIFIRYINPEIQVKIQQQQYYNWIYITYEGTGNNFVDKTPQLFNIGRRWDEANETVIESHKNTCLIRPRYHVNVLRLDDGYVLIPVDKSNNIVIVCNAYCIRC